MQNKSKVSSRRVVHIQLDYYQAYDDTLTFKLLNDGAIQFWAYHEEAWNAWDSVDSHEEMVICKDEIIPVLNYLQSLYAESTFEIPLEEIKGNKRTYIPQIQYLCENYSLITDDLKKLLEQICTFLHLSTDMIHTEKKIHLVFEKLAEFFLKFFILHGRTLREEKYYYSTYYDTLRKTKEELIAENLITDMELGKIY